MFFNLPLILIILFLFLSSELVFFCTFPSNWKFEGKIQKFPYTKKKRYNVSYSSLRQIIALEIPVTAAILTGGDVIQHLMRS